MFTKVLVVSFEELAFVALHIVFVVFLGHGFVQRVAILCFPVTECLGGKESSSRE